MAFRQRYPQPANEADFERLCLRLLKAHWNLSGLELYGRRGERQQGIDILDMSGADPLHAAQCKLYDPQKTLPPADIRREINAARKFEPAIGVYALMTTAKISTQAQKVILEINRDHSRAGFRVELFTWERISALLTEYHTIRDDEYKTLSGEAVQQINESLTSIEVRIGSIQPAVSSDIADRADALHREIDEARALIEKGESQTARFLLQRMRTHKWDQLGPRHRFRVVSNIGAAYLRERDYAKAAQCFLEAAVFQPDDLQAAENEALAYLISLPQPEAFVQISRLQSKFPNSPRINSFWISTAPTTWKLQEIRERLTSSQQAGPEPLTALAGRALNESNFSLCDELISRSLEQRPIWPYAQLIRVRSFILQTLDQTSGYSVGVRTERLVKAETWVSEALESASEEHDLAIQAECLLERAQIRLLLTKNAQADEDIQRASILVPTDPSVRRAVADTKFRHGQVNDAVTELRELLTEEYRPDIALRLAQALHIRKSSADVSEAITLLERILDHPGPVLDGGREYIASLLIQLLVTTERWEQAEAVCDKLAAHQISQALLSAYRARVLLARGNGSESNALADTSVSTLKETAPADEVRWIASLLSDLGRHLDALPLWRRIAAPDALTEDSKHYFNCAQRLGRDDLVIEMCATLRKNGVVDRELTLFEVQTLEQYDVDTAISVLTEYIERNPEDKEIRLRRSLLGLTWDRPHVVDPTPAVMPCVAEVSARTGRIAVQVLKLGGYPNDALAYGYELLRKHFNESDAHLAFMFNLHPIDPQPSIPKFDEVLVGTAVAFIEEGENQTEWLILEDSPDPDASRSEYSPDHPIAQAFLGKKVGDRVILAQGSVSQRAGIVMQILSKYVFRYQDCGHNLQLRFPSLRALESVKVRQVLQDGKEQYDLSAILRSVEDLAASTERLRDLYKTQFIPVAMIAAAHGKTVVEATLNIAQDPNVNLFCSIGTADERKQAFEALDVSNTWIIEASAVATILLLDLEQDFFSQLPCQLAIAQGTLAELNEMLRRETLFRGDGGVLTKINERVTYIPISASEREQRRQWLLTGIEKLKAVCKIVGCVEFAKLDTQKRNTTVQVLGQGGAESAVLAAQPGHLLWTDDLRLATVARTEQGVKSSWTQAILQWATSKGFLDPEQFATISAKLIGFGYHFTSPSLGAMVAAAQLADWNPTQWPLAGVLHQLGNESIDIKMAAVLAVQFMERAYRDTGIYEYARTIVQLLLDKLALRSGGLHVIDKINGAIPTVFGLNALAADDALSTIQAWHRARKTFVRTAR